MIDIHMHILPYFDDGARSWEDALEMAEIAVSSGVSAIIATIHSNFPETIASEMQFDDDVTRYNQRLHQLQDLLVHEKISLTVYPGMEVFIQGNVLQKLKQGRLLTLNRSHYTLIEFPMHVSAKEIYEAVCQLRTAGINPVLAHPERYYCVQKVPAHVYEWHSMGAVIQMNKGSILGRFGQKVVNTAHSLLKHQLVDVVASDAHRPNIRTPNMEEVSYVLLRDYGEFYTRLLLQENPERIIQDAKIFNTEPIEYDYSEFYVH